ncbi:MAG: hypothetical protein CMI35_09690 [Owenweeksia sp.]|nr:hypothetical protein [Owenweeksia sp.]|tara:strand:- start:6533 stop:7648 length:1116 start_codon:yes stop_codon:yes gene_type:complete
MHDWQDDRIFQRACAGLARLGHEVHLVAVCEEDQKPGKFESLKVTVHLLPHRSGRKRRWNGSKDVIKAAVHLQAEVYEFHDPDLLPHIGLLKKKVPGSAVIYDIHENYAGRFANWGLPAFLGDIFRSYEKKVINGLDGITVVSESMSSLFKGVRTPVEITRNSTDIERLRGIELPEPDADSAPVIVTSGSHSHARNCLQTVKALPYLVQDLTVNPVMQFVGRYLDNMDQEMEEQAKADGTSDYLKIDGMMPWEENFKRIAKAYCGCVFYEDNPNNRVGIPNRLFEYMYCGIPVVVSDFPELKKVVTQAQCGVVVNSEDPRDIARGLEELLSDPEKAREMGRKGRQAMEGTYGYHVDLEILENFYYKLLKRS